MKTIVCYFDFMGKYQREKESDYINYKEGNKIFLKELEYTVMSISHDESENVKIVNAYCTFRDREKTVKENIKIF